MGFTAGMVHIAGATVSDLATVGLVGTGDYQSGDYALMGDRPAVFRTKDGIVVVDGTGEIASEDAMIAAGLGRRVTSATLGSTSTVYRIAVMDPTSVVREIVDVEGERQVESGEPLSEETGDVTLDEDETFDLFQRLTGVSVRDVIDGSLELLDRSDGGNGGDRSDGGGDGREPAPRKKGFFGRLFG